MPQEPLPRAMPAKVGWFCDLSCMHRVRDARVQGYDLTVFALPSGDFP